MYCRKEWAWRVIALVGRAELGVLWGDVCKVMVGGEAMCLLGVVWCAVLRLWLLVVGKRWWWVSLVSVV